MRLSLGLLFASLVFLSSPVFCAEFSYRLNEDMGTLDWGNGEVKPNLVLQLMEGLVRLGPNGEPQPALAKSWKKNGNQFEFTLKKNIKWSDGERVCANHFVDAWNRVKDPAFASPYAHYLALVESAQAVGCEKLVVNLKYGAGFFPQLTSHWVLFPIRSDVISKFGKEWILPKNLKVTGPYILTEWVRDQYYVLKKNPYYHSKNSGPDTVKAFIIKDDATALSLFDSGKLDWLSDIPFIEKPRLSKRNEFHAYPTLIEYHLGFRINPSGLDKTTRCALLKSLDKKQIPKILQGHELPSSKLSSPDGGYKFDPVQAKKELHGGIKKITVHYYNKDIHNPIMEWIQQEWKKNLGLDVELVKSESKSYWSNLSNSPPEIFLSGITAAYSHPHSFLNELQSKNAANWGHFSSATYDRLVEDAARTPNGISLTKIVNKAEDILVNESCAVIPLYFRTTSNLVSKKWAGFAMNKMGYVYLKDISLR